MLIDFLFDFETLSRSDLKVVGPVNYALDPSTQASMITWCFGRTGPLKAWRKGQPLPAELIHVMENPHLYRFIAQNLQFDYLIWTLVFSKLFSNPVRPTIENLDDLMAIACHFRMGASLESIAQMLNLPLSKDAIGRTLMLKQCKPNSKGEFYELTAEEWISFERYGIMDTRILRDAYYMLPPLPAPERWAWEWTFRRNLRGLCIDDALVNEMESIIKEAVPKLLAEFDYLVGFKCKLNSPVKCKEFFQQYYPEITSMDAESMRELMADTRPVPPNVRRALEIKDLAGSTSIAKIKTAINHRHNGRIYAILAYHFTQTKRFAGRGIQIQNFPRVVVADKSDNYFDENRPDYKPLDMDVHDLASKLRLLRPELKDPVGMVKNLLRRIWIPSKGKTFYCGDFSKVEPAVIFWLVGLGPIPKKCYEEMASEIYNMDVKDIGKESIERQIGKAAFLSCQYGTGWEGFRDSLYKNTGIWLEEVMARQVISAYRRKFPEITKFWSELEGGFRKAIYGQSSALCNGKVHIMPMSHPWKGVQIRLPSGGYLFYHKAQESTQEFEEEVVELRDGVPFKYKVKKIRTVMKYLADQGGGRIGWEYTYSGKLCENVVSATARDIMIPAMWRLEQAGFDVLNTIHDEVWAEAEAGRDEEFTDLMCISPSWCDMAIGADRKVGVRYLK